MGEEGVLYEDIREYLCFPTPPKRKINISVGEYAILKYSVAQIAHRNRARMGKKTRPSEGSGSFMRRDERVRFAPDNRNPAHRLSEGSGGTHIHTQTHKHTHARYTRANRSQCPHRDRVAIGVVDTTPRRERRQPTHGKPDGHRNLRLHSEPDGVPPPEHVARRV